ncbi:MAG: cell division protein FtsZ, partial [Sphingomicrobium sp.]
LLDGVSMKGAKGVIISITGGEDMRLMEVDEAASHIKELVDPDANIIWGSAFNNNMEGKIRVSVVATGIEAEMAAQPTQGKVFTFPTTARPATITPSPEPKAEIADEEPLDLTTDDEAGDELLLDSEDILADPVLGTPIAPPADEDDLAATGTTGTPATATKESGTLFERMSNIARGAAQAKVEDEPTPSFRREPLDIPRFLNRQNNQ